MMLIGKRYLMLSLLMSIGAAVFSQTCQLDPAFGNNGLSINGSGVYCRSVGGLQLDDQSIISYGASIESGEGKFTVIKYDEEGSLDLDFGMFGASRFTVENYGGILWDAVELPNKKICIVGEVTFATSSTATVTMLDSDGIVDTAFGIGGHLELNMAAPFTRARAVVETNGYLYVAGSYRGGGAEGLFVVKLDQTTGLQDVAFGSSGLFTYDFPDAMGSDVHDLVLTQSGNLYAFASGAYAGALQEVLVLSINQLGILNPSFGTGGILYFDSDPGDNVNNYVSCFETPDAYITLATASYPVPSDPTSFSDFVVTQLDTFGNINSSFGTSGTVVEPLDAGYGWPTFYTLNSSDSHVLHGRHVETDSTVYDEFFRYDVQGVIPKFN